MWDPVGSRLVLLSQLSELKQGQKVRFLGCIHSLHKFDSILLLGEQWPECDTKLHVSYQHALDAILPNCLRVGEWVNVVGEVTRAALPDESLLTARPEFSVDATKIWSAGAIDLEAYSKTILQLQALQPHH